MPKYKWQGTSDTPIKKLQRLNQHRESMIEDASRTSSCVLEETVAEWNMLLKERDKTLRKVIEKDNQVILTKHMEELLNLLQVIGKLDHKNSPSSLRTSLCFVYQEVNSYLSNKDKGISLNTETVDSSGAHRNNNVLDMDGSWMTGEKDNTPQCTGDESFRKTTQRLVVRQKNANLKRPRPFTPKQSPLVAETSLSSPSGGKSNYYTKKTPTTAALHLRQLGSVERHSDFPYQKPISQTPGSQSRGQSLRTPTRRGAPLEDENLRCNLLKGKENLKSTPGISRSPGGTPQKASNRSFNLSDAGDLVAYALKKKFLNIRKLYASPQNLHDDSRDDDTNISID